MPDGSAAGRPLIILAPPRSFSSVVCGMIGQHPQLFGLPELNLFLADTLGRTVAFMRGRMPHGQDGLLRLVAELEFGGQSEQQVEQARRWIGERLDWSGSQMLRWAATKAAPCRLVEKSPSTVMRKGALERAAVAASNALFLHLTRHPLSFGDSLLKFAAESADWGRVIDTRSLDPEKIWWRAHREILDFLAQIPPERRMQIRGEDILQWPQPYLRQIAQWLGVDDADSVVAEMLHPERSLFAHPGPDNAQGGADPGFLESPALRERKTSTISLMESAPWLGAGLADPTRELARQFGYR